MSVDDENSKDVLAIKEVRLSAHKGEHPDDSEDYAAIGLSSEEEAEISLIINTSEENFRYHHLFLQIQFLQYHLHLLEIQVEIQFQSRFQLECSSRYMKH